MHCTATLVIYSSYYRTEMTLVHCNSIVGIYNNSFQLHAEAHSCKY